MHPNALSCACAYADALVIGAGHAAHAAMWPMVATTV